MRPDKLSILPVESAVLGPTKLIGLQHRLRTANCHARPDIGTELGHAMGAIFQLPLGG